MLVRNVALLAALCGSASVLASDGVRVAAWNITFYNGGFPAEIGRIGYDASGPTGEAFAPDILLLQEVSGASAVFFLTQHLNNAAGSPGDWAAAPTYDNGNLNTALVYRTSVFDLLDDTLVSGGSSSANPRNIVRYDLRLGGYESDDATFAFYPTHMKAGSSSSDQNRRNIEAQRIVADVANLPTGWHYILGGDFNTQSSSQASHRTLLGNLYNTGTFRDPISRPGAWQNSSSFRVIHTQDPAGQMDDRYDQILVSPSLVDDAGAQYIGAYPTAFNLALWNDPNHSYRALGNDGTTYNSRLRTTGNASVSAAVAQDLITTSGNSGHVPVYLDLAVPAVTAVSDTAIDLGDVAVGTTVPFTLGIGSGGDVGLWGASGIELTTFDIEAGPGLTPAFDSGFDIPGGALVNVGFTFDAAAVGSASTYIDVLSNGADDPVIRVDVTANVTSPSCSPADFAPPFGVLDLGDIDAFIAAFDASDLAADIAEPFGVLDLGDIDAFIASFLDGCS
ncbi:MAG: endonuclease/exonuclease/phosphatase family protein [Planctomycetota bacterium]